MKKLVKIIAGIIIALIVVIIGLQLFLNHGLNPVVQKALPQVSETLGLDVAVEDVSINLFKGTLSLEKVGLGNPQGYQEPTVFALDSAALDVGLRNLLKGVVQVSDASVKNAKITLVRNKDGNVNLTEIQQQLQKKESAAGEEQQQAPPRETEQISEDQQQDKAAEPVEIPKIQIDNLGFTTQFQFIDHKTTNAQPNRLGIDLAIDAADIVTFGTRPQAEWGTLNIKGGLHEKPDQFVVDIKVKVAPLTDPAALTFTAQGSIVAMNLHDLGDMEQEIGITSQAADITITLNVVDGAIQKGSKMVATLHNAELVGKLKKKHKNTKLPPDISITIPISGTLATPEVNIIQAVTTSLLRNIAKNPDYLLDNVTVDGKSLRERLQKALGGGKDK